MQGTHEIVSSKGDLLCQVPLPCTTPSWMNSEIFTMRRSSLRGASQNGENSDRTALSDALETHLQETQIQIERLEQVFESLGETAYGKQCEGIAGILEETKDIMAEDFDDSTMDACLIAAAQHVEHYGIAAYGTVVVWAQAMGHEEAARLLQETLNEEKAADEKLTALANSGVNEQAAAAARLDEDEPTAVSRRPATKRVTRR